MLNNFILVGRVKCINDIDPKVTTIQVSIPRSFKNENGEYDTDIIEIDVMGTIKESAKEYLKSGDVIGIKGRIENKDGLEKTHIVAEKLTFLSSKKEG